MFLRSSFSSFSLLFILTFAISSCSEDSNDFGTCSDGILNQNEINIDCGGNCPSCGGTCTDGIQNQNETDVDCGGQCPACNSGTCSDNIKNQGETGIDCGGPCPACASVTPPCNPATDNLMTFPEIFVQDQDYYYINCAVGRGANDDNYHIEANSSTGDFDIYFPDTSKPSVDAVYYTAPSSTFLEPDEVEVNLVRGGGFYTAQTGQKVYVDVGPNGYLSVILCQVKFSTGQSNLIDPITATGRVVCD